MGKVLCENKWVLWMINLCDYGVGKYKNVDDIFVGGGVGMVLCFDVFDVVI